MVAIVSELEALPWDSLCAYPTEMFTAFSRDDIFYARFAEIEAKFMRGKVSMNKGLEDGRALMVNFERIIKTLGKDANQFDFEKVLQHAESAEKEIFADFKKLRKGVVRVRKVMIKNHPHQRKDIDSLLAEFDSVTIEYLEGLQEIRWELVYIRAELEKDQRGPVFDNPADLRAFVMG